MSSSNLAKPWCSESSSSTVSFIGIDSLSIIQINHTHSQDRSVLSLTVGARHLCFLPLCSEDNSPHSPVYPNLIDLMVSVLTRTYCSECFIGIVTLLITNFFFPFQFRAVLYCSFRLHYSLYFPTISVIYLTLLFLIQSFRTISQI